jgi:F-type H+-transporting ATPase subunit epsilon
MSENFTIFRQLNIMKLEVVTPEKIAYSQDVDQVTIQTTDGQITILPHHISLVTTLKAGELLIKTRGQTIPIVTGSGFAQIDGEKVSVLTDLAQETEEIDEKAVEEARKRAAEALKERGRLSSEEHALTAAALEKALAQLKVKRKHARRLASPETSP